MADSPIGDLNVVLVKGTIAAPPEHRRLESGSHLLRYLVTTRSNAPRRRVDVLPVVLWNPDATLVADPGSAGTPLWVVGSAQRRYPADADGRRSEIELVAHHVQFDIEPPAVSELD